MKSDPRPERLERMVEDPTSAFIAKLMDVVFVIPGTSIRFGFDSLIGLFPGIGDSIGALISSVILSQAAKMGVPKIVLTRMAVNILINTLVGFVPVFGDVFSVFFRSNVRNYELLQRYAGQHRATGKDWMFVLGFFAVLLTVIALILVSTLWIVKRVWNWL